MIANQKQLGIIDRLSGGINTFLKNLNLDTSDVIRIVSWFGLGFLCGMLLRRYIKYIILFCTFAALIVTALQYFDVVSIHEGQIKALLGFSETETFDTISSSVAAGVQLYAIEFGIGTLGFLLGFKV